MVGVRVLVKVGAKAVKSADVVSIAPLMLAPTRPLKLLAPMDTTPSPNGAILITSTVTVQLANAANVTPEMVTSPATLVSTVPPQLLVTAPRRVPDGAVNV